MQMTYDNIHKQVSLIYQMHHIIHLSHGHCYRIEPVC